MSFETVLSPKYIKENGASLLRRKFNHFAIYGYNKSQLPTQHSILECSVLSSSKRCTMYIDLCILLMLLHHKLEYLSFCISTLDSEHEISPWVCLWYLPFLTFFSLQFTDFLWSLSNLILFVLIQLAPPPAQGPAQPGPSQFWLFVFVSMIDQ